ncbi:MAG: D-lyxose/D-mannose family sugar isomerase [Porphyromonadaceae bacterium]|nr:MAG: D-lyxose/D-mannose family sugar isomerase [Porphyromonadaceae bacterium]
MNESTFSSARLRTIDLLDRAKIVLTDKEKQNIEIADLGVGDLDHVGLEVVQYINNDRYCAKELVLFSWQICLEHRHPKVSETNPGKMETFRCRWGEVYLYTKGDPTPNPKARVSETYLPYLTAWNEVILLPGEQYTIPKNTLHWFQAGPDGCVVSEFSSASTDENDVFTDPRVKRV